MQLIQLKIRGLGNVPETEWMPIKSPVTIFRFDDRSVARNLLTAIQTVNPPYDCRKVDPFHEYPTERASRNGYRKLVQPSKRTIAFAVFNSSPPLVTELASISELFYETDRIEVGRRLDYSRWISFVELASSCRWSEIESEIKHIQETISISAPLQEKIRHLINEKKSSDRIKGDSATMLDDWLSDIKAEHDNREVIDSEVIDSVTENVRRAAYFNNARQIVNTRIPLFLALSLNDLQNTLEKDRQTGCVEQTPFPPVALVDLLDNTDEDIIQLLNSLHETATDKQSQYLCFINKQCSMPDRYDQLIVTDS